MSPLLIRSYTLHVVGNCGFYPNTRITMMLINTIICMSIEDGEGEGCGVVSRHCIEVGRYLFGEKAN